MDPKKYVPDGCYLTCDKGTLPCRLKVTHHNNVRIYGDNLASEADLIPNQNLFPMGVCAVTHQPCMPQPLYWDKAMSGITVNGHKLIIDEAKLLCAVGGQVEIHFTRVAAIAATGTGAGLERGIARLSAAGQENPAGAFAELKSMGGQFSENFQQNYHETEATLPVEDVKWSQKTAKRTFGNGRPLEPTRNTIMRRGGQARGAIQPLEVVRMSDGTYTSLDHRRGIAAVEGGAKELPVKIHDGNAPIPPDQAQRFELNKDGVKNLKNQGHGTYEAKDAPKTWEEAAKFRSANQGGKFPVEGSKTLPRLTGEPPVGVEAGALAPPSRATSFLANVSESIQSRPGIARANDFLIRNAESVSRVGKVVGKGLIVVGIAVETYRITKAYEADGNRVGQNTLETTGSAVGGLGGAIAGAEIGATIGVVGGPVGVLVGGVVGGIVGGIAGSALGKSLVHEAGAFFGSWSH